MINIDILEVYTWSIKALSVPLWIGHYHLCMEGHLITEKPNMPASSSKNGFVLVFAMISAEQVLPWITNICSPFEANFQYCQTVKTTVKITS